MAISSVSTVSWATLANVGGVAKASISSVAGVPAPSASLGEGYSFGGLTSTSSTINRWIDGLNFDTDAAISVGTTMASTRARPAAGSSSTNIYIAGGQISSGGYAGTTSIERFVYSNRTISTLAAVSSVSGEQSSGTNSSTSFYIMGGLHNNTAPEVTTIQKMPFATEVRANLASQ